MPKDQSRFTTSEVSVQPPKDSRFPGGFTLGEIADITGGRAVSLRPELRISGISTDSRTIRKGELFIAISGEHFDGANFISDAIRKGAAGAVVPEGAKAVPGSPFIRVKDTKRALGLIAASHRDRFNIPVIVITGSNGKTTTKDMVAQVLNERFRVLKTHNNENNKIGVAHTLLKLKDQDIAVIEVGTDSRGEIRYHSAVLRPGVAVITNIGPSHLKGLRDAEGVLREKFALIESLGKKGVWIKNADDTMLSEKSAPGGRVLTYGIRKGRVNFKAYDIRQTASGMEFKIKVSDIPQGELPGASAVDAGVYDFKVPVLGIHNAYNALAAIATCSLFVDIETMQRGLYSFVGPKMRMQVFNMDSVTVINDAYNSNPFSFRCAVSALKTFPVAGRRIVVCADMLELGGDSERLHYESGRFLAEEGIDRLITFGEKSHHIARGAIDRGMDKDRVDIFRDKNKVALFLRSIVRRGDVVLVKGSRGMKMEEVADCFINCSTR